MAKGGIQIPKFLKVGLIIVISMGDPLIIIVESDSFNAITWVSNRKANP